MILSHALPYFYKNAAGYVRFDIRDVLNNNEGQLIYSDKNQKIYMKVRWPVENPPWF